MAEAANAGDAEHASALWKSVEASVEGGAEWGSVLCYAGDAEHAELGAERGAGEGQSSGKVTALHALLAIGDVLIV